DSGLDALVDGVGCDLTPSVVVAIRGDPLVRWAVRLELKVLCHETLDEAPLVVLPAQDGHGVSLGVLESIEPESALRVLLESLDVIRPLVGRDAAVLPGPVGEVVIPEHEPHPPSVADRQAALELEPGVRSYELQPRTPIAVARLAVFVVMQQPHLAGRLLTV